MTFLKLDLFLPSGEGRKTPTLLSPLKRLTSITGHSFSLPSLKFSRRAAHVEEIRNS
jgi:hypothetical protein